MLGEVVSCLVPVGNKVLLEWQLSPLRRLFPEHRLTVLLPESYAVGLCEQALFARLDVGFLSLQDGLSPGEALAHALQHLLGNRPNGGLKWLRGDRLFEELPEEEDVIALTQGDDTVNGLDSAAWAGFFSFSDAAFLQHCLAAAGNSFTRAVRAYAGAQSMAFRPVQHWSDFGHVNTYFAARARMTTGRAFNQLRIHGHVCSKRSVHVRKLQAEVQWYRSLPPHMRHYCPRFLGTSMENGLYGYATAYIPSLPLSELFVYGKNPVSFWERASTRIAAYLADARSLGSKADCESLTAHAQGLYDRKTRQRLQHYLDAHALKDSMCVLHHKGTRYSLGNILEICIASLRQQKPIPGLLHGDLCFSNMFFDASSDTLKLIDPRGMNADDEPLLYGDLHYDLAKLAHSVIGLYDHIMAGAYTITMAEDGLQHIVFPCDARLALIQEQFLKKCLPSGADFRAIMHGTVLLFLSMLPLHDDDAQRQQALLLNAVRLFRDYILS